MNKKLKQLTAAILVAATLLPLPAQASVYYDVVVWDSKTLTITTYQHYTREELNALAAIATITVLATYAVENPKQAATGLGILAGVAAVAAGAYYLLK